MKIKCQNKVNVIINYKKMFVKNFYRSNNNAIIRSNHLEDNCD